MQPMWRQPDNENVRHHDNQENPESCPVRHAPPPSLTDIDNGLTNLHL
jgi:hypothetical protein